MKLLLRWKEVNPGPSTIAGTTVTLILYVHLMLHTIRTKLIQSQVWMLELSLLVRAGFFLSFSLLRRLD